MTMDDPDPSQEPTEIYGTAVTDDFIKSVPAPSLHLPIFFPFVLSRHKSSRFSFKLNKSTLIPAIT